jgi:hypothetical protein
MSQSIMCYRNVAVVLQWWYREHEPAFQVGFGYATGTTEGGVAAGPGMLSLVRPLLTVLEWC